MSKANIYENGEYLNNNPGWHEEDAPWKAAQIIKILNANKITPKRVCEIGCGSGAVLSNIAKYFDSSVKFSGYEISPHAFAICKNHKANNVSFYLGDPFNQDLEKFDVAIAADVIEHVEDYFSFLRNLKPKSEYKIFHIPLDISVQMVVRCSPIIRARERVGHIHYFTKETALATLKDTGYEILDYFYTPGLLELPNRSWKSKILKIPRKLMFYLNRDITVRILGGYSLLVLTK